MTKPNKKPGDEQPAGSFQELGRKLDQRPEVQAAAEALRAAHEHYEQAKAQYYHLRDDAAQEVHSLRGKGTAEVIAMVLEMVRKHPGPGVVAALMCGWFAGRIFRR